VVGPIIKQRHKTARLTWARARRRWRIHTWQHIIFSDESQFLIRFRDEGYRIYRSCGKRFTDQCMYESDRLDGGNPFNLSRRLSVLWRCLMIGPTTGRLDRTPDSRSLLRKLLYNIRKIARLDYLRALSSFVIIRFRRFWKFEFHKNVHITAPPKWPLVSGGYGSGWKDSTGRRRLL
jgi:hypothetical protein